MAPFADKIVESLAHRYPDACRDALNDVKRELSKVEEDIGVVPTRRIALGRDYLAEDARIHGGVILYVHHGGRVGDGSQQGEA